MALDDLTIYSLLSQNIKTLTATVMGIISLFNDNGDENRKLYVRVTSPIPSETHDIANSFLERNIYLKRHTHSRIHNLYEKYIHKQLFDIFHEW